MINELLIKYKDQQPKQFGEYHMEKCYPVTALISMLEEYKQSSIKNEVEIIKQIYFEINISEHESPEFIKQRLRKARKKLNELSSKLRQHQN